MATEAKSGRGGRREGAGRIPTGDAMETYPLRLKGEQRLKVDALGGPEWIRRKIEAEPWPAPGSTSGPVND